MTFTAILRWRLFLGFVLLVLFNVFPATHAFQSLGARPIQRASLAVTTPLHRCRRGRGSLCQPKHSVDRKSTTSFPFTRPSPTRHGDGSLCMSAATGVAPASPAIAWWYMTLLALQFGTQPILTKRYTPTTICRSTVVLAQEVSKLIIAGSLLWISGSWTTSVAGWSVASWWIVAGIPAALYVVQNYATLMAYQNLAPVTFNVLNQTKTLSAALCCFLVMGRRQSKLQIVSLLTLLMSALVIEKIVPLPFVSKENKDTRSEEAKKSHWFSGVIPIMIASFISGLAGALTQRSLQFGSRNSYLFTMELSAASILMLMGSLLLGSPDRKKIQENGVSYGWTRRTWLPVVTNASGGVVVGLVTKHAGAVRKGFALIFGLLLSGVLQNRLSSNEDDGDDGGVTSEQVVGGIIASVSLWMHARFPYVVPK